jgi:4-amino-4-deoxy-L-arabinose transferase-like glycosyltransferase
MLAVALLAGVGAVRIISTYHVFNGTTDEPAAVAAGMEWLVQGTYTLNNTHPPLARIAAALGPYLAGLRLEDTREWSWTKVGPAILYARGQYLHNLSLARLGIVPFFLLTTYVVWRWSRKLFGDLSALLAVLLFTTLPPILAHSGLATTDMALTATVVAALLALDLWLEAPNYVRSCALGVSAGLAILSKFSSLLFLPLCGAAILICHSRWKNREGDRRRIDWRRASVFTGLVLIMMLVTIWSGYRFSVHVTNKATRPHEGIDRMVGTKGTLRSAAYFVAETVPVPAPDLVAGIYRLWEKNKEGHTCYLLGQIREDGWWYFFLVVLAVKTPLAFLFLTAIAFGMVVRRCRESANWALLAPAAAAVAVLLIGMTTKIDLGVRLILLIYPLLAVLAGFAAGRLWNLPEHKTLGRAAVVVLVGWQLISSARIHPDYLAYFNELASRHPDRVLVDSDLDWGQDLLRLADALRARKIDSVTIAYFGLADLDRHNLPPWTELQPYQPATGWIAISEMKLKTGERRPPYRDYAWLEAYEPVAMVGKSIRLYYIPGGTGAPGKEGLSGTKGNP